jgi:hypothetical protein
VTYSTFRAVPAFVRREADGELLTSHETHALSDPAKPLVGLCSTPYPLRLEWVFSREEPFVDRHSRRIVFWQPDMPFPRPKGWMKLPFPSGLRCTGFTDVGDGRAYWDAWPKDSRYARRRWHELAAYRIEEAGLKEFEDGFRVADPHSGLYELYRKVVRNRVKQHPGLMRFRAVWHPSSSVPVGGSAIMYVPEARASVLVSSFFRREHGSSSIGTGIVDDWFAVSIADGYRFMDFDLFWAPGDPRSWRGYSRFKAQFNTTLVRYPHPFFRIVL